MKITKMALHFKFKYSFFIVLAIGISLSACNPVTDDSTKVNTDSTKGGSGGQTGTVNERLVESDFRMLYIKHFPDSNELEKLLEQPNGNDVDKLVLQFLQDSLGNLTLAAFAGKKKHQNFKNYVQILHAFDKKLETPVNLAGNICFPSQEISRKGGTNDGKLKELEELVKNKKYGYITFTPKDTVYPNNPYIKYIIYELGYLSKQSFMTKNTPIPLNIDANPCPPWNVFE